MLERMLASHSGSNSREKASLISGSSPSASKLPSASSGKDSPVRYPQPYSILNSQISKKNMSPILSEMKTSLNTDFSMSRRRSRQYSFINEFQQSGTTNQSSLKNWDQFIQNIGIKKKKLFENRHSSKSPVTIAKSFLLKKEPFTVEKRVEQASAIFDVEKPKEAIRAASQDLMNMQKNDVLSSLKNSCAVAREKFNKMKSQEQKFDYSPGIMKATTPYRREKSPASGSKKLQECLIDFRKNLGTIFGNDEGERTPEDMHSSNKKFSPPKKTKSEYASISNSTSVSDKFSATHANETSPFRAVPNFGEQIRDPNLEVIYERTSEILRGYKKTIQALTEENNDLKKELQLLKGSNKDLS